MLLAIVGADQLRPNLSSNLCVHASLSSAQNRADDGTVIRKIFDTNHKNVPSQRTLVNTHTHFIIINLNHFEAGRY